jgi:hypothetical protein
VRKRIPTIKTIATQAGRATESKIEIDKTYKISTSKHELTSILQTVYAYAIVDRYRNDSGFTVAGNCWSVQIGHRQEFEAGDEH